MLRFGSFKIGVHLVLLFLYLGLGEVCAQVVGPPADKVPSLSDIPVQSYGKTSNSRSLSSYFSNTKLVSTSYSGEKYKENDNLYFRKDTLIFAGGTTGLAYVDEVTIGGVTYGRYRIPQTPGQYRLPKTPISTKYLDAGYYPFPPNSTFPDKSDEIRRAVHFPTLTRHNNRIRWLPGYPLKDYLTPKHFFSTRWTDYSGDQHAHIRQFPLPIPSYDILLSELNRRPDSFDAEYIYVPVEGTDYNAEILTDDGIHIFYGAVFTTNTYQSYDPGSRVHNPARKNTMVMFVLAIARSDDIQISTEVNGKLHFVPVGEGLRVDQAGGGRNRTTHALDYSMNDQPHAGLSAHFLTVSGAGLSNETDDEVNSLVSGAITPRIEDIFLDHVFTRKVEISVEVSKKTPNPQRQLAIDTDSIDIAYRVTREVELIRQYEQTILDIGGTDIEGSSICSSSEYILDAALPAGTPFTVHSFSFPATVFNSGTSFKPGKSGADLVKHDGTNWKVYPEVLDLTNVGNVAVRLEIHRKIIRNGNQEHGGFTYVSVYAPPIVLFTNLQDSYCESALTHSISINVEGALKSTGPGLNELVGMFSFFASTRETGTYTNLGATADGSYLFNPGTLYTDAVTALSVSPKDSLFIRLHYQLGAGDIVSGSCQAGIAHVSKIYKLPDSPTLEYHSGGTSDEYCVGTSGFNEIIAVKSDTRIDDDDVFFDWYSSTGTQQNIRGEAGNFGDRGIGKTLPGAGYTPTDINSGVVGPRQYYVSQVLYTHGAVGDAGYFEGCSGYVSVVDVEVTARQEVPLSFSVNGVAVDKICVVGAAGTSQPVKIVPVLPGSPTNLGVGSGIVYTTPGGGTDSFASSITPSTQLGSSSNPSIQESTFDPLKILETHQGVLVNGQEDFSSISFSTEISYTVQDGNATCTSVGTAQFTINPLPRVSIENFETAKRCVADVAKPLTTKVGALSTSIWSQDNTTGTFNFQWLDGGGNVGGQVTAFYDANSLLDFSEVFDLANQGVNNNVPSPSATSPPTRPNFRLTFQSVPSRDFNGCVNTASVDFTVYPVPESPDLAGGVIDYTYCQHTTTINPVGVDVAGTGTYAWYSTPPPGSALHVGNTYTPVVNTASIGVNTHYVTVRRYAVSPFLGCESAPTSFNIDISAPSPIDLSFDVGGGTGVTTACIGDGDVGTAYDVNVVLPVTSLGVGERLAVEFVYGSDARVKSSLDALLSNRDQVGGLPAVSVTDVTFSSLDALRLIKGMPSLALTVPEATGDVRLKVTYNIDASCAVSAEKTLIFNALPTVNITPFDLKYCVDRAAVVLKSTVAGSENGWTQSNPQGTGTFSLEWLKTDGNVGGEVTAFYDTNSQLDFSAVFDPVNQVVNDNVPSPSAATPPTRPNFKLTFLSGGGQGRNNGCVNRATAFFTVYPRPGNPGITHASLGALDEYCSAVTSIAAITATANPAGAIATFQWYDHALNLQGSLPQGDAIAHTPIVSLSPPPAINKYVPGTYHDYVAQILYADGSFVGCESFVTESTVEISPAAIIDFDFFVGGTGPATRNVCVGDGEKGTNNTIHIVPSNAVAVNDPLVSGQSFTVEFVSGGTVNDLGTLSTLNGLVTNGTQTGGVNVTAQVATFNTLEVISGIDVNVSGITSLFSLQNLSVRATYTSTAGGTSCSATRDKLIAINPLPAVTIQDFASKHCTFDEAAPLRSTAGGVPSTWVNGNASTGMFNLEWLDGNGQVGGEVTAFYDANSQLDFSAVFDPVNQGVNDNVPTLDPVSSVAGPNFRLTFLSAVTGDRKCVNRVSTDFTAYARPPVPVVNYVAGGTAVQDEYCQGSLLQPVGVVPLAPLPGVVSYRWYDDTTGPVGMEEGLSVLGTSSTQLSQANVNTVGTYRDYVSQVFHADGNFAGCESYVNSVVVEITAAPTVTFEVLLEGETTALSQLCISDKAGASHQLVISPTAPAVRDVLGGALTFEISSTARAATEFNALLGANRAQVSGARVLAIESFSALDLINITRGIGDQLSAPSEAFNITTFEVKLTYDRSVGGTPCVSSTTQAIVVSPLPRVSLEDFSTKHCGYDAPTQLTYRLNNASNPSPWASGNPFTGTFSLSWESNLGVSEDVPVFHKSGSSSLEFDEIFSNSNNPSGLMSTVEADFELTYTSNAEGNVTSADLAALLTCVNRDVVSFTVYPRPADPPTVNYTAGPLATQDEYCKGTTRIGAVNLVTDPSGMTPVSFNWYERMRVVNGGKEGRAFITADASRTPHVEVNIVGTYKEYVSQVFYADAGVNFAGCESHVDSVIVEITAAPTVKFKVQLEGETTALSQLCIADKAGASHQLVISPTAPVVGDVLGGPLTFEISSTAHLSTKFETLLGANRVQVSGDQALAIESFSALDLINITRGTGDQLSAPSEAFNTTTFEVKLTYDRSVGGTSCVSSTTQAIVVYSLPRVSLEDFSTKHCGYDAPIQLTYRLNNASTPSLWASGNLLSGTFSLSWENNLGVSEDVPVFHKSGLSFLEFDEIFSNTNNPSGLMSTAEADFKLTYTSNAEGNVTSDLLLNPLICVNRDVVSFTVYPRPADSPTVNYTAGPLATQDEYCKGTTRIGAVSLVTEPTGITPVSFNWYSQMSIVDGGKEGRSFIAADASRTPHVEVNTVGTYKHYVSQVFYADGNFAGCESHVDSVVVEITAASQIDFQIDADGQTDVDRVCVADGVGDGLGLTFSPSLFTLGANESVTFEVTSTSLEDLGLQELAKQNALFPSISNRFQNTAGSVLAAKISAYDLARIARAEVVRGSLVYTVDNEEQVFENVPLNVDLVHRVTVNTGAVCVGRADTKTLAIFPLPVVSIADFGEKHCRYEPVKVIASTVSRTNVASALTDWRADPLSQTGTLELYARVGTVQGARITAFHDSFSQLDFSVVGDVAQVERRLIYTSHPSIDRGYGCVNRDTLDFTVYPRPALPVVLHATANPLQPEVTTQDEYCTGARTIQPVSVSNSINDIVYKWYGSASGAPPQQSGADAPTLGVALGLGLPAASYTPTINTASGAVHSFYVSQTHYVDALGFAGCESYVSTAKIAVTTDNVPTFTFDLVGGAGDISSACIAGDNGLAQSVNIVPVTPITLGATLPAGSKLSFDFEGPAGVAMTDKLGNSTQRAGATVAVATFSLLAVLEEAKGTSLQTTSNFTATPVTVKLTYAQSTECSVTSTQTLSIAPLPRVSIQDFRTAHCQYDTDKALVAVVNTKDVNWAPNPLLERGFLNFYAQNGGNYIENTGSAWHTGDGRFIFNQQTGDEDEIYRLVYTSHPREDNQYACVNRDTLDFTIFPRPALPSVIHASGGTQDEYCVGATNVRGVAVQPVPPTLSTVNFRWYGGALDPDLLDSDPGEIGQSFVEEGTNAVENGIVTAQYSPAVSTVSPATVIHYVTQTLYTGGGFNGCESYVSTMSISVRLAPKLDIAFDLAADERTTQAFGTDVARACVAYDGSNPTHVRIIPKIEDANGVVVENRSLSTGQSIQFEFVDSDDPSIAQTIVTRTGLLAPSTDVLQLGGAGKQATPVSFLALGAVRDELAQQVALSESFAPSRHHVRLLYTTTLGGSTCQTSRIESLPINPSPVVSIQRFGKEHCQYDNNKPVRAIVQSVGVNWIPADADKGNLQFYTKDNNGVFIEDTGNLWYANAGRFKFSQQAGNENEIYRLVYTSHSSRDNQYACVNKDTVDFAIFPRPAVPLVAYHAGPGFTQDTYCKGVINLPAVTVQSPIVGATYKWYGAHEVPDPLFPANRTGFTLLEETDSYTPGIQQDIVGVNTHYVSVSRYGINNFAGCESFVNDVVVEITDAPRLDIAFDLGIDPSSTAAFSSNIQRACIASSEGQATYVRVIPLLEASGNLVRDRSLDGGQQFAFEFVDSDQAGAVAIGTRTGLLAPGTDITQIGGLNTLAKPISFLALDVVKETIADQTQGLSDPFASNTQYIRLTYSTTVGGFSCENSVIKSLHIDALPRVSINNFASKYCDYSPAIELEAIINNNSSPWNSTDVGTGTFSLKVLQLDATTGQPELNTDNTPKEGTDVSRFYNGNSDIDFSRVFADTNVPELRSDIPPQGNNFRLILQSAPTQDNVGCVNRDTLDFTVYPRPAKPELLHVSNLDRDVYCYNSGDAFTTNDVGIVNHNSLISTLNHYKWYSNVRAGLLGEGVGVGNVSTSSTASRAFNISNSSPGTVHEFYVSALNYMDGGGFVGCESYVDTARIALKTTPTIGLDIRKNSLTAAHTPRICIADIVRGSELADNTIYAVASGKSTLSATESLEFSFYPTSSLSAAFAALLVQRTGSKSTQTGVNGLPVPVTPVSFSALEFARILRTNPTLGIKDLRTSVSQAMRLAYVDVPPANQYNTVPKPFCTLTDEQTIQVLNLPEVQIDSYDDKQCRNAPPVRVGFNVNGSPIPWVNGTQGTGDLFLQWKNASDTYEPVPDFYNSSSALDFDIIFSSASNPSGIAPSASPDFRFLYASHTNLLTSCVSADTVDFVIYPVPVTPVLDDPTTVYCAGGNAALQEVNLQAEAGYTYRWYRREGANVSLLSEGISFTPTGINLSEQISGSVVRTVSYEIEAVSESNDDFAGCRSTRTPFDVELIGAPEISLTHVLNAHTTATLPHADVVTGDPINITMCLGRMEGNNNTNTYDMQASSFNFSVRLDAVLSNLQSSGVFNTATLDGLQPDVIDPNSDVRTVIFNPLAVVGTADPATLRDPSSGIADTTVRFEYTYTNTYKTIRCETSIIRDLDLLTPPQLNFFSTRSGLLDEDDAYVEICVDEPSFELRGNLGRAASRTSMFVVDGGRTSASSLNFDPTQLRSEYVAKTSHKITFIAERSIDNQTDGCQNFKTKTVDIRPIPQIDFTQASDCANSAVDFTSTVANGGNLVSQPTYTWRIEEESGANFLISNPNDQHIRAVFREGVAYDVQLTVDDVSLPGAITPLTCSNAVVKASSAGLVPIPVLAWLNVVAGLPAEFEFYESKLPLNELQSLDFSVKQVESDQNILSVNRVQSANQNLLEKSTHSFTTPGLYEAELSITSSSSCVNATTHRLYVVPHIVLGVGDSHQQNFDNDAGGWYSDTISVLRILPDPNKPVENGKPVVLQLTKRASSWGWGVPKEDATFITGPAGGSGKSWITNTTRSFLLRQEALLNNDNPLDDNEPVVAGFLPKERSFLYSPEFDIGDLLRPMVQFDIIYDFDNRRSGVVMQYSTDGGKNWYTVGNYNPTEGATGINWYNFDNIAVDPGDQSQVSAQNDKRTDRVGWAASLEENEWVRARNRLDDIPKDERSHIRFRFALSAANEDVQREGIGLDNFWIVDRNKVVLVEEFSTELTEISKVAHEKISEYVSASRGGLNNTSGIGNKTDALRITYYSYPQNAPGTVVDRLYDVNAEDVNTRQLFYGIKEIPSSVIDGINRGNVSLAPDDGGWTEITLNRAVLANSLADVDIEEITIQDYEVSIRVNVSLTGEGAVRNITGEHRVFIVITEELVQMNGYNGQIEFRDVMRKILPNSAGTPVIFDGQAGVETVIHATWQLLDTHVQALPVTQLVLHAVAFIQNHETKEIYQATVEEIRPQKLFSLGVDDHDVTFTEAVKIYPNPVRAYMLEARFRPALRVPLSWEMVDQRGIVVDSGIIRSGVKLQAFDLTGYVDGFYHLLFRRNGELVSSHQLLVDSR